MRAIAQSEWECAGTRQSSAVHSNTSETSLQNSNALTQIAGALALAAATSASTDASAMSYLMMRDDALLAQSPLVVSAEVVAELPGRKNAEGLIADTRYALRVDWIAKGKLDASQLVLKLPGSRSGSEPGLHLDGVPGYIVGDRVLVFAEPAADGTYRPMQLALGLFREVEYAGDLYYVRDLREADALDKAFNAEYALPHRAEPFLKYLAAKRRGAEAAVNHLERLPEAANAKYNLMRDGGGVPLRWTRFDSSASVGWYSTSAGQAGMAADEGTLVTNATAAWTNDATSRILMNYAGTVASDNRSTTDTRSVVSWSDPSNEIAGSFSCAGGGTLAIGGPWWSGTSSVVDGTTYRVIVEGFVVMQDGAQCFFDRNGGADGAETLTHEIGHAIGFGHSCGDSASGSCSNAATNDAVMRASIHGDGRGARLGSDDVAAAARVYPQPGGGTPPANDLIKSDGFE